ncbi:MAG: hypothetical protein LC792_01160 [Actinobacteria bacterium]|nr:hypothetical protein [Actinomycetota bacterium]
MATVPADLPDDCDEGAFVPIDDGVDAPGMTLDELLAEIALDEPITLPQPAAAYLEEAREAGET